MNGLPASTSIAAAWRSANVRQRIDPVEPRSPVHAGCWRWRASAIPTTSAACFASRPRSASTACCSIRQAAIRSIARRSGPRWARRCRVPFARADHGGRHCDRCATRGSCRSVALTPDRVGDAVWPTTCSESATRSAADSDAWRRRSGTVSDGHSSAADIACEFRSRRTWIH